MACPNDKTASCIEDVGSAQIDELGIASIDVPTVTAGEERCSKGRVEMCLWVPGGPEIVCTRATGFLSCEIVWCPY